jgi:hypothetical protein
MATRRKTAPPPTVSGLARKHGVSRETIRKLRENGIDLADEEAVADGLAASKAQAPDETLTDLKRRKLRLEAERLETIVAREKADLVPMAEIEFFLTVVTATFKAALKSLCGAFPGEAEGLTAPAMQKLLVKHTDGILEMISEGKFTPKPYGKAKPQKP